MRFSIAAVLLLVMVACLWLALSSAHGAVGQELAELPQGHGTEGSEPTVIDFADSRNTREALEPSRASLERQGGLGEVEPLLSGEQSVDAGQARDTPRIGLQNLYPEDYPITRGELPELLHRLAKLGPGVVEQKFEIEGFLNRIDSLTGDDAEISRILIDQYEQQVKSLRKEAGLLFSEAQDDWLLNENFLVYERAESTPTPRARNGSHFATDCFVGLGPFVVDMGFRSGDYPDLEYVLGVMKDEKERLRTELNLLLELRGLPRIGPHN